MRKVDNTLARLAILILVSSIGCQRKESIYEDYKGSLGEYVFHSIDEKTETFSSKRYYKESAIDSVVFINKNLSTYHFSYKEKINSVFYYQADTIYFYEGFMCLFPTLRCIQTSIDEKIILFNAIPVTPPYYSLSMSVFNGNSLDKPILEYQFKSDTAMGYSDYFSQDTNYTVILRLTHSLKNHVITDTSTIWLKQCIN
jgi:hypothetical protein